MVKSVVVSATCAVVALSSCAELLPAEIGLGWENGWVREWRSGVPGLKVQDFTVPASNGLVKVTRRWTWGGTAPLHEVTLSVRYRMRGDPAALKPFIPGVMIYGNPSNKGRNDGRVPMYFGGKGEFAQFEEHRLPMPFVLLEDAKGGAFAALHVLPSPVRGAVRRDQWWSAGVEAREDGADILLLSGPIGYNRRRSLVKCRPYQWGDAWGDTYITLRPGQKVEKTFWIQTGKAAADAFGFERCVAASLDLFRPETAVGRHASVGEILRVKRRYLLENRWIDENGVCGFNQYDCGFAGTRGAKAIHLGWTGGSESSLYALAALDMDAADRVKVQRALDFICDKFGPTVITGLGTFKLEWDVRKKRFFQNGDAVSCGQALYSILKAVRAAERGGSGLDPAKWREFSRRTAHEMAVGLLKKDWYAPKSSGAAFLIAPLVLASEMYAMPECMAAAQKLADFYEKRYTGYDRVYWGGSLDASCEDKEGAMAAFQGYVAMLRHAIGAKDASAESKYRRLARHAMHMYLSYMFVWDVPMPPGALADAGFKTTGWTVVSAQNQCLDLFALLTVPELWWMGGYLGDGRLKDIAWLMFRSCFQLTEPDGNSGEQILHTNYRHMWNDHTLIGGRGDAADFRGGYDMWNPLWLTGHFLCAAADLRELGAM
ncbi:MAG: hypothetical protein II649_07555 [Kiritimatiellae bacterium]|nr:hypothetical protein [Kiritimatiellia bacterium]